MLGQPFTFQRSPFGRIGGAVALLLLLTTGCHRSHYRERADRDAYRLVEEKAQSPHAELPDYSIEPDPRSRMFNPNDPDREPMPPDDPESHRLMQRVDSKKGCPHWDRDGYTPYVENPDWYAYLPLDEEGVLVLDSARAMHLALLHSREYQQQLENLYVSALRVSFERFRFDTQFFGGYEVDYRVDGPQRNPAVGSQSVLTAATFPNIQARRLFATGSEMVVGFANSLVWQFSGPTRHSVNTVIDLTLVQPLLRGAGRARVLEGLTQSERELLAEVRQLERFRRAFYVEIMTGRSAGPQGFLGTAGQAGGFIGLLQTQQQIRNQLDNLNALRSNYFRLLVSLEELLAMIPDQSESIVRQRLQVAQARSALLGAESRYLVSQTSFQLSLDSFKMTLGLPPELVVRLDDPMLEQFSLIDPAVRPIQDRVSDLQSEVGHVLLELLPQEDRPLVWSDETADRFAELARLLEEVELIRQQLMDGEDAQILRAQRDGLRLASKLKSGFRSARAEAEAAGETGVAAARAEDLELLRQVLARIEEEPRWFERLTGYTELRDALGGIDRARQQLARGLIDLRWMATSANSLIREFYQQNADAIDLLDEVPPEERPAAIADLEERLLVQRQRITDELEAILEEEPWLGELERWRIRAEEVELLVDDPAVSLRRWKRLFAQFVDSMIALPGRLNTLMDRLEEYQGRIETLLAVGDQLESDELAARFRRDVSPAIPQELVDLSEMVVSFSLMQARNRAETVELIEVDLHPAAALAIARDHRRDWMNRRAELVDRWRLIEFHADSLKGGLNVVFSGDIRNRTTNPFSLHSDTGQLRVGLQFDAPLTRLLERNTYRESLIAYQRERRSYYAFEDSVSRGLRDTLRSMQLGRENFEIRREAVRAADQQIELNDDIRRIQEATRMLAGPTAARDAVSALTDLLNSQNEFLSVWVTYEVLRRTLDLDLGTMELDSEGLWIDPGPIGPDQGQPGIRRGLLDEHWPGPHEGGLHAFGPHGPGPVQFTAEPEAVYEPIRITDQ